MTEARDITKLVWPFPQKYIHANPGSGNRGSYVKHAVVEQRLLDVLGGVDFELVRIIHGFVEGKPGKDGKDGKPDLADAVVGVVMRMTGIVDGQRRVCEEAGDCEDPHNWPHDGARLKDAMSDAYKRCAFRGFGVALHLWASTDFYLGEKLGKADGIGVEAAPETGPPAREPESSETAESEPSDAATPETVQPTPESVQSDSEGAAKEVEAPNDETIWKELAVEAGLTQGGALKAARSICKRLGLVEPPSLALIPDEAADAVYSSFRALAEARSVTS